MNKLSFGSWSALVVFAGALGCAGTSDYVYTPNTSNATAAGLPASRTLIPPEPVDTGPVKELVETGDDVDVTRITGIVHSEGDAGPYISSCWRVTLLEASAAREK